MAWEASATTIINGASVTSTETFSSAVTKTPGESHHATVDADFPATPTDDLIVNLYGRVDGTNWADTPMWSQTIDNGTDPNQIDIPIAPGLVEWRLGVLASGATDTITVTAKVKGDQVDL